MTTERAVATMGLTPMEDSDLRRLASFDRFGFLDDSGKTQLLRLRARDRRTEVRKVAEVVEQYAPLRHVGAQPRAHCSIYPR